MTDSEAPLETGSVASSSADRKPRIAQPPYLQLRDAIRIAEQIYEQGAGVGDSNLLTKILNNSISSSSFTRKLQAMRLYKLTSSAAVPVELTETGITIVAPKDETSRGLALKTAAIGPEVFRRNYERFKGKLLPQDDFLRNTFIHDLQLPPNKVVADAWIDCFRSALDTAGLLMTRPDGKVQVLEGPQSPSEAESKDQEEKIEPKTPTSAQPKAEKPAEQGDGHTTRITLADGRLATVFIPDRLTQRDATRLKGALAGISAIIESMVEESAI
jgi:hypothetical protein